MGLFDDVRCDMPLPADPPPPTDPWFQTKTFEDPYMEKYVIQEDGRLMHYTTHERMEAGEGRDTEYHGDLEFYTLADYTREWWCYVARFNEGRCAWIKCTEHRAPENAA